MVRAEQKPGRRRADPSPSRLRRSRPRGTSVPVRRRLGAALWFVLVAAGLVAVVVPWTPYEASRWVPLSGAVALTTLFTHGLAVRTGGRPLVAGGMTLVLAAAAVLTRSPVMLAGAAVGTAVVSALLAVLSTKPAARYVGVILEVLIATVVAGIGAFAVHAYGAVISTQRTEYLVTGISLLGALVLVYRLGAGLHGLGRRGFVMVLSGIVLLTVILAYTAALARWGSPGMIETVDQTLETASDLLGATPRPIEVLLGFPALAWGVSTRARRRQGWWVCAFGAAGFAAITVSLLGPSVDLVRAGLGLLYSLVLGLFLGYVVVRADLFLTGPRGRRARRLEEQAAHRPEPGRLQPLL